MTAIIDEAAFERLCDELDLVEWQRVVLRRQWSALMTIGHPNAADRALGDPRHYGPSSDGLTAPRPT